MSTEADFIVSQLETPQRTRVLVPIRYPLTAQSTHTLDHAAQLARTVDAAEVLVLHVNLFQDGDRTTIKDISSAVEPILGDLPTAALIRRGFLLEEIILEEATRLDADIIVLGQSHRPAWRRALSRLLGNDPDLAAFLTAHTDARIEQAA